MTDLVKQSLEVLRKGEYKNGRVDNQGYDLTELMVTLPKELQDTVLLEDMLRRETPYFLEHDIFGFNRSQIYCPIYYNQDGKRVKGMGGNITPNYRRIIENGFDAILAQIDALAAINTSEEQQYFYEAMRRNCEAVLEIAERYRLAAEQTGKHRLAEALARVPHKAAETFYEACLFQKLLIYAMRCARGTHITLGRFDQYMLSYFEADLARGISREELLETLELFFISLNVDGDLYFGVQQGDNGQSLVLGGFDKDGNDQFNDLSRLCMDAALELSLIDPKINLRVGKKTPDWLYEYGTKLTKQGLGFPQYCNDDVIVPYMMSLGYDEEDAYNYTVAACWEVISPNNGCDVPNIATFSFPEVMNRAVHQTLATATSFEELMKQVREQTRLECEEIQKTYTDKKGERNCFLSLLVDGCMEKGADICQRGAKYHNYGCHGAGIATAADSLAAIRKLVFEEKTVSAQELLDALEANFEGYEPLRNRLLACPKMGNNDDYVDAIAAELMTDFEDFMHGKPNGQGGIWRAGTGSAMEYILTARKCGATADGRLAGDAFGCSFSPSVTCKLDGPLSVIQSFTKHDLGRIANGGPLTMELHDTVFRNEEGEKKVAQLVKAFVYLGGHQFQLNSINRDRLLDAQEHPEDYPNLIVRVWGWSGYFCELDKEYQDHIIRRTEFSV